MFRYAQNMDFDTFFDFWYQYNGVFDYILTNGTVLGGFSVIGSQIAL